MWLKPHKKAGIKALYGALPVQRFWKIIKNLIKPTLPVFFTSDHDPIHPFSGLFTGAWGGVKGEIKEEADTPSKVALC